MSNVIAILFGEVVQGAGVNSQVGKCFVPKKPSPKKGLNAIWVDWSELKLRRVACFLFLLVLEMPFMVLCLSKAISGRRALNLEQVYQIYFVKYNGTKLTGGGSCTNGENRCRG